MAVELSPRAEILLKSLVDRYIKDGQPVGSRTLSRQTKLELSAATVRNIMSDLEEMGLIFSPHTSAGRIPTESGYRLFVDSLLTVKPLNQAILDDLEGELSSPGDPKKMLETASDMLSSITHYAGLVMLPRDTQATLKQIEFVPLSGGRILTIMVSSDGQVQNRVMVSARPYNRAELLEAANFFNDVYAGQKLPYVRKKILAELDRDRDEMNRLMRLAISMAGEILTDDESSSEDMVVSGEANLLGVPDLAHLDTLRDLFETFKTKRQLLDLLDNSANSRGIHIFIGEESGCRAFGDCSIVTAGYQVDGYYVGTLGVIGPTRMAYEKVIPMVDVTARLLGAALSQPPRG
ncbi:MAG TPA: heat-inducible transcriptional repressor HrcA [Gammaproteobacteria bacterium]|nr:heat-inducible transcriptional repressor HrcA [Gammaproteobacteria bacterium]